MTFEPISSDSKPEAVAEMDGEGQATGGGAPEAYDLGEINFDEFAVEGEPGADGIDGEPAAANENAAGLLTKDQFWEGFRGCFNVGQQVTALESLGVPANDMGARAASDAVYDIALETEYLRFLIQPGNVWVQRALVIGAFTFPKYMGVKAELAERRALAKAEKDRQAAANDNGEDMADAG